MTIVFVTSHIKTQFYYLIAKQLESYGHRIMWISNSSVWTQWLRAQEVPISHILDITTFGREWTNRDELTRSEELILSSLERSSELNINNIILMDRVLRTKPLHYGRCYLFVAQREIRKFLLRNTVNAVILEVTWAHEIITASVCKQIGCLQFCPHNTRIPGDRFTFFEGYRQSQVAGFCDPNDEHHKEATAYYDLFCNTKPEPHYMRTNDRLPSIRFSWLRKFFLHLKLGIIDPYDLTRPTIGSLVRTRLKEVLIRGYLALSQPFEEVTLTGAKPFVLYTLHEQPESSIDVFGSYYSNQVETIKIISRSLPSTHELFVKEHRVSIGKRSPAYYRQLRRIPRVRLIDPWFSSHELIKKADLVITVSGTVAYEAALYRTPAITLIPMFFGSLLTINGINSDYEFLSKTLSHLLGRSEEHSSRKTKDDIIHFLAWIMAQSFKGIISDPITNPACMERSNISTIAGALNTLLHKRRTIAQ